ncbi:Rieske 2Fe-2S domain-containing protein [uncultured Sphingomonas sp.]|uniref:Rieske 2Fe-2S domain-containing protein n=1 Tax=uncultured Sphingomonas sp. TaxID=158754 RepID=UPI0030D7337B
MSGWPAAVAAGWHPVAIAARLGTRPLARRLMDVPLVVFAADGVPVVMHDRCPHRAMPLSAGRVQGGAIVCPYHGWAFGADGGCRAVPGARTVPGVAARTLPVRVAGGLVWTTLGNGPFPRLPAVMDDPALDRFWWVPRASTARVLDALENHLDPAHPHLVHPWLVRAPHRRRPARVEVTVDTTGAHARYMEDARATGLLPRLLEGHRWTSIGRLHPPTIGEVAFTGRDGPTLSIAVVFVPESARVTRPYAHFATPRGMVPAAVKRWLLTAFHWPILQQDRRVLARQATREGDYARGPLDFLGPAIWGFANGTPPPPQRYTADMLL